MGDAEGGVPVSVKDVMESIVRTPGGSLFLAYVVVDGEGNTVASGLTLEQAEKLRNEDRYNRRIVWKGHSR